MAIIHISALRDHILDRIGYVLLSLYHLKNDLYTLTYIFWASINAKNVKVMDVENILNSYQQASQKVLVNQVVRIWMPDF